MRVRLQPREQLRRLLEVRRKNGCGLAGRLLEAGRDRHLGAKVAGQPKPSRGRPVPDDRLDAFPRSVFGAVVHEDRLDVEVPLLGDSAEPLRQRQERPRIEIDGHDDRDPLIFQAAGLSMIDPSGCIS